MEKIRQITGTRIPSDGFLLHIALFFWKVSETVFRASFIYGQRDDEVCGCKYRT
jgi:hypothetical protein